MSIYAAMLGQMLITTAFASIIFFRVLLTILNDSEKTLRHKKLLFLTIGMVTNSLAIFGVMAVRSLEFYYHHTFLGMLLFFYVLITIGTIFEMVSAGIGKSYTQIKLFAAISLVWIGICIFI